MTELLRDSKNRVVPQYFDNAKNNYVPIAIRNIKGIDVSNTTLVEDDEGEVFTHQYLSNDGNWYVYRTATPPQGMAEYPNTVSKVVVERINTSVIGEKGEKGERGPKGDPGDSPELINNLNSTSTTAAPTAAMAKELNDKIGTLNDQMLGVSSQLEDTLQIEQVQIGVGIVPEMLVRTPEMDDRAFLQQAIDYCEANNAKLTLKQNHTYNLSGALYFTGLNLEGNGATLSQTVSDEPILMSRVLFDKSGGIGARVYIRNLTFLGNINNSENHGLYITTFWSKYENLEFQGTGGSAIYLTTTHKDGTLLAWGTLVENMFRDIIVRDSGGISILMGDVYGNNKITDGVLENILISNGADAAIYIGAGAGWAVRGVHTYASSKIPKNGIHISNAFNTSVTDVYIECFLEHAFVFDALQRNLALTNINVTSEFGDANHSVIKIDRQTATDEKSVGVTANNINIFQSDTTKSSAVFEMVNTVEVDVSGLTITGEGRDTVKFSTDTESSGRYRYMLNSSVGGRLQDKVNRHFLAYEGRQIKQSAFDSFWSGPEEVSEVSFPIPKVGEYGKLILNVSIHGSLWDDGNKTCTWVGQVYVSRKTSGTTLYPVNIVTPYGFDVEPALSIDSEYNIKVSFSTSTGTGGIVAIDYVVCSDY